VRWSIDAADAYSVAKVRRAVIKQLKNFAAESADLYAVETVLGELLGAEMERGHLAVAVIVEPGASGPAVDVYMQGTPAVNSTQGEIRNALLQGITVPMSIESTTQGTHIRIRLPAVREEQLRRAR